MFKIKKRLSIERSRIQRRSNKHSKENLLPKLNVSYNSKPRNYKIDFESSCQDYSIQCLLERINRAKKTMMSKRRNHIKEIKSLHSKINSKNRSLNNQINRRLDTNWRPRRAISLDGVLKKAIKRDRLSSGKNLRKFGSKNSQALYQRVKDLKRAENSRMAKQPATGFLFSKTKIRKIALNQGDLFCKLPRDVKGAFGDKIRGMVKGSVPEKRIPNLTAFLVNSLFRAKYLNKFQLVRSPEQLFISEPNSSNFRFEIFYLNFPFSIFFS